VTRGFRDTLGELLKARFPILLIETWEEERAIGEIVAVAADPEHVRTPRQVLLWSATAGLVAPEGNPDRGTQDPGAALQQVLGLEEPTVAVFKDLHGRLGHGNAAADAGLVRRLRDAVAVLHDSVAPVTIVLLGPVLQIPIELEKSVTVLDFPLPTEEELRVLLHDMLASNASVAVIASEQDIDRIVKAAVGLTSFEAENAFARAMAKDGQLGPDDVTVIVEEKRQTIRKSGILEFIPEGPTFDEVGGLENLKRWLGKRAESWLATASGYALDAPRGVLVTGVPGCGKSLTAKCTASLWGLPLLRMDVGRVFAGLVGSSEQNMRQALRTAESIAPSILWIDEIEKGFSSSESGDSGTSQRVFGTFLTWMQEKDAPVFVVATANAIDRLPPEFLRKGRFDEIFFVDLPTTAERVPIWRVHLQKRLRGSAAGELVVDDRVLETLASETEGFSGAEIEQAVATALFDAFAERRPLAEDDLLQAIRTTVPLSTTSAEQIHRIRAWADVRAVAATAQTDRGSYQFSSDSSPGESEVGPAPDIGRYRGGRTVDF
jgi:SpoVK/Ycf46/Vps4 family AAA+-type ATPase